MEKCICVIINDIDDLVHSQKQGNIGMYNDVRILSNSEKIYELIRRLYENGFDVYITSDHGHRETETIGSPRGTGVEMETKSKRTWKNLTLSQPMTGGGISPDGRSSGTDVGDEFFHTATVFHVIAETDIGFGQVVVLFVEHHAADMRFDADAAVVAVFESVFQDGPDVAAAFTCESIAGHVLTFFRVEFHYGVFDMDISDEFTYVAIEFPGALVRARFGMGVIGGENRIAGIENQFE